MRRKRMNYSRPYLDRNGNIAADKVTLRDFLAARWQRQQPDGAGKLLSDLAYLMGLPIDANRPKLSDRIPYSDKKLATLARKFTSISAEFAPNLRRVQDWPTNKEPVYPAWCRGTTQSKPCPFESGSNMLPGLDPFARQISAGTL